MGVPPEAVALAPGDKPTPERRWTASAKRPLSVLNSHWLASIGRLLMAKRSTAAA